MKSPIRAVLAAALLGVPAGGAAAATFDFAAMADLYSGANGGQEATYAQMNTYMPSFFTDGGISVANITSGNSSGAASDPFFDSGVAGLGVCSSGTSGTVSAHGGNVSACSSANGVSGKQGDDNVTLGESVKITFDTTVAITDLFFRNGGHNDFQSTLFINGDLYSVTDGKLDDYSTLAAASMFTFTHNGNGADGNKHQFYLSTATVSAVPVPAGLLLMGTALGGFGLMRRRRKAA